MSDGERAEDAATRVLVVAAYASVRAGLRALLDGAAGCEVVGQASGSGDMDTLLPALCPAVILADDAPDDRARVLSLSAEIGAGVVLLAEDAGSLPSLNALPAWALLPKDAGGPKVSAAVQSVAAGLIALDRAFLPALSLPQTTREILPGDTLTAREREVLQLLTSGLPNKQIAARLGISAHTVKFHVASLLAKLGASSRTEAVTLGARRGDVLL